MLHYNFYIFIFVDVLNNKTIMFYSLDLNVTNLEISEF